MSARSSDEAPYPRSALAAAGSSSPRTSSPERSAAPPKRVTIRGVEIGRAGTFEASTGRTTLTSDDFAEAVRAFKAGVHPKPVLKVGHYDPRFDGSPSIGWVDNLRVAEGGQVLIGDLAGVPQWVADSAPSHFPNRSLEATFDYEDADGTVWPFVLTGLALLGATAPAIGNLAELRDFVAASRSPQNVTRDRVRLAAARRARLNRWND
ncbi:hypothetical protein [Tsukamurella paurometabola]|uniref:Uncharacterized protein n=1 Tax=Tsukamurella paurometabola TaxID=2061 RepID=A0A3P8L8G8_TSUPA|nr:hypothetical protein [Tsukamurella paurometabola]UEA83006.1 hypothetical protein LK411_22060 [Tsukamurella paurometabola]VDR40091.1 Uncharacterised protein [Tsukamurella paurometabola]